MITAVARFAIRAEAVQHPSPTQVFAVVDRVLRGYETWRFCTSVLVRPRRRGRGWSGTLARAGHDAPFVRRANGAVETVGEAGSLLGIVDEPAFLDSAGGAASW